MNKITIGDEERRALLNVLYYHKKSEEREIAELLLLGGNKDFIPQCEEMRDIFKSLIKKFMDPSIELRLNYEEKRLLMLGLDFFKRAEERAGMTELARLAGLNDSEIERKRRLDMYISLIETFKNIPDNDDIK